MQPSRGKINLYGKSKPGYMLQRDHLLDWRTVEENVLLSLQVKHLLTKERRAHALRLIDTYGLGEFRRHYPRQLSGGMRQKVALIRTLAFDPSLLLLDEPAAGMNPTETEELLEIIDYIRSEFKVSVLLIEHDMNLVMNICEGIAVLNFGRVIAKGTPDEIRDNPQVIEAYLGKKEG